MKKYIICSTLMFIFSCHCIFAQKALDVAADASCKCIEEKYDKTKNVKVNENLINSCIQKAFMTNVDAFTEEYGTEFLSDEKKAYAIGEQLGVVIAKNCPAFIDFSMQLTQASEEDDAELDQSQTGEIIGKVVNIENKEFVHVIVQNDEGKETDLIWLRYFQNSDQFKGKTEGLKGKDILVKYIETEVYLPKAQDYFKVKEITEIQLK